MLQNIKALLVVQSRLRSTSKAKLSSMNDQKVAITFSESDVERSNPGVLSYFSEYHFSCILLIGIIVCPRSRVRISAGFHTFLAHIASGVERSNPGVPSLWV